MPFDWAAHHMCGTQGNQGVQAQLTLTAPTEEIPAIEQALNNAIESGAFERALGAAGSALTSSHLYLLSLMMCSINGVEAVSKLTKCLNRVATFRILWSWEAGYGTKHTGVILA